MAESPTRARWRHAATGRTGRVRNRYAFLSLICGICAWVPLVILVTGPLAVLFALLAFATTRDRSALEPARAGLVLTAMATVLQGLIFVSAGALGWLGALLGA